MLRRAAAAAGPDGARRRHRLGRVERRAGHRPSPRRRGRRHQPQRGQARRGAGDGCRRGVDSADRPLGRAGRRRRRERRPGDVGPVDPSPQARAAGSSCAAARRGPTVEINLPRLFFKQYEIIGSSMGSYQEFAELHPPRRRAASTSTSTRCRRWPSTRPRSTASRPASSSARSCCGTTPVGERRDPQPGHLAVRHGSGTPSASQPGAAVVDSPDVTPVRPGGVHRRGSRRAAALLHQPRRPGVRPGQPARGGQGRAVRPLQPQPEEPAPAVPRRVRRRPRRLAATRRSTRRSACARAEQLYEKVFFEYGDDSVAQLGGVHLACEQASNLLTKVLEWGRLMSYLEQSTRYIAYDARLGGRYRYFRDPAILASRLGTRYVGDMDRLFDAYSQRARRRHRARAGHGAPRDPTTATSCTARPPGPRRSTPSAACCRRRRCRTSASTAPARRSRRCCCGMRAHPLPEARAVRRADAPRAAQGDPELPAARRPARAWRPVERVPGRRPGERTAELVDSLFGDDAGRRRPTTVTLVDFDPDAEDKLLAAICYPHTDLPEHQIARPGRPAGCRPSGWRSCGRTSASGRTGGTSRAGRSSASTTASTCCPTTARSATCSATGCSRSSGSR